MASTTREPGPVFNQNLCDLTKAYRALNMIRRRFIKSMDGGFRGYLQGGVLVTAAFLIASNHHPRQPT